MKTITAIFDSTLAADQALIRLETAGIPRERIGLVVTESTRNNAFRVEENTKAAEGGATGAAIGGVLGALAVGLTAVGSIVVPGLGIFAAGPVIAALAGAGAGGAVGGLAGSLIGLGVPEFEAGVYEEKLQAGNILVAVETNTDEEEKRVKQVFDQYKEKKAAA